MPDVHLVRDAANRPTAPEATDGHPAPARRRVPLPALWFGFLGAPAAWTVQTLVNLPLAAHSCFPRLSPIASPTVRGLRGIAFAVSIISVAVCVAALVISWRAWRRTREEHQGGSGRSREHEPSSALLETGEGRTRFMALGGLLASVMFLAVTAMNTATVFLVSPCGS